MPTAKVRRCHIHHGYSKTISEQLEERRGRSKKGRKKKRGVREEEREKRSEGGGMGKERGVEGRRKREGKQKWEGNEGGGNEKVMGGGEESVEGRGRGVKGEAVNHVWGVSHREASGSS